MGGHRNFPICAELAAEIALKSKHKAESHRLGHETSEDALTWNVFAGLGQARKLKLAVHFLTGRTVTGEPRLYLWGELIDPEHRRRDHFEPLREVRGRLEPDIHTSRPSRTPSKAMLQLSHLGGSPRRRGQGRPRPGSAGPLPALQERALSPGVPAGVRSPQEIRCPLRSLDTNPAERTF